MGCGLAQWDVALRIWVWRGSVWRGSLGCGVAHRGVVWLVGGGVAH
jgi:hypothetical protein